MYNSQTGGLCPEDYTEYEELLTMLYPHYDALTDLEKDRIRELEDTPDSELTEDDLQDLRDFNERVFG